MAANPMTEIDKGFKRPATGVVDSLGNWIIPVEQYGAGMIKPPVKLTAHLLQISFADIGQSGSLGKYSLKAARACSRKAMRSTRNNAFSA